MSRSSRSNRCATSSPSSAGWTHPNGRRMGGHDTGDVFLTARTSANGNLTNYRLARPGRWRGKHGNATRYSSLTLSTRRRGRRTDPCDDACLLQGRPADPCAEQADADLRPAVRRRHLRPTQSSPASSSCELRAHARPYPGPRQVHQPQASASTTSRSFQEYLDSVRVVEKQAERAQAWLDIPKPKVDPGNAQAQLDAR